MEDPKFARIFGKKPTAVTAALTTGKISSMFYNTLFSTKMIFSKFDVDYADHAECMESLFARMHPMMLARPDPHDVGCAVFVVAKFILEFDLGDMLGCDMGVFDLAVDTLASHCRLLEHGGFVNTRKRRMRLHDFLDVAFFVIYMHTGRPRDAENILADRRKRMGPDLLDSMNVCYYVEDTLRVYRGVEYSDHGTAAESMDDAVENVHERNNGRVPAGEHSFFKIY